MTFYSNPRGKGGLLLCLLTLFLLCLQYPGKAQAVTDGLIEYWSFENTVQGAYGSVVNAQGTVNYVPGHDNVGQAIEVGATSDVAVNHGSTIVDIAANPDGLTFSGWIFDNRFNIGGWGTFYSAYNFSLVTIPGASAGERKIQVSIVYTKDGVDYAAAYATLSGVFTSDWHHVAITLSPDQSVRLFLDGEETYLQTMVPYSGGNYKLGGNIRLNKRYGGTSYFDGKLDEYMFFNKVLSRDQIKTLHDPNWVSDGEDWPVAEGISPPLIRNGLVAYWPFENSTLGYNGSVTEIETNLIYVAGKPGNGQALLLDETSVLKYDNHSPVNEIAGSPDGFSFAGWINDMRFGVGGAGTMYSAYNFSITTYENASGRFVQLGIVYENGNMVVQTEPGSLTTGWHHVAFTVNSDKSVRMYLDGVEVQVLTNAPYPGGDYKDDGPRYVNLRYGGGSHFIGEIDEYMFFNRPLSDTEIQILHDPNSIGEFWKLAGINEDGGIDIYYEYGNVGIGTAETQGYDFAVAGKIIAEEVKVKLQSNWPDYVFEDDYPLPSLEEVRSFVEENHHLPDIPSDSQVEEEGIELGEMDAKLLQKIEELTLYLMDVNDQLKLLKKENEDLRKSINELREE